ncbi:metal-dependent hydrolase [Ursidibacter maritimus]|uniref:metal-dependent hydrolase n=1 Tax=Ursidibacter maritimus TaxID=1331689 RepID=UPI001C4945FE|nr:metal-dependent hydrolase [Ursidibacter maritimus]MBV6541601.1 metal-dependent hydrolase [Ursidibacter maritimus]
MDSVTQFVLGAAVQGVGMGKYQGGKALLYGGLLGTLPDLDVFIPYADSISSMTYHRGFSHSIFVLTALAFVMTWLIFKLKSERHFSFLRLFLTITLALVTHPIIDAMTVYGTQLFWPISTAPEVWSTVFIIDPIYTFPLVFACLWALLKKMNAKSIKVLNIALILGFVYFGTGFIGRFYHEQRFSNALSEQGVEVEKVLATPTPFNTILWRVIAVDKQGNLYDGVSGWFDKKAEMEWIKMPLNLPLAPKILSISPETQRLKWFTDDWLHYEQIGDNLVVSDIRMGMAGQFNFRFIVAKQENGEWMAIQPKTYPMTRVHLRQELLGLLWQRMWSDKLPLPLERWVKLGL